MIALTPAEVVFEKEGVRSVRYDDIYASAAGGPEETRHVFHDSIDLTTRWASRDHFTIVETGFGTGLNFLATAQCYLDDPNRPGYLDYVSIEKHPFTPEDLRRFYLSFPAFHLLSAELIRRYPPLVTGFHKLWLVPGKVSLTLCFQDVGEAMKELVANVDCWFLDGFAPAVNAEMWSDTLFKGMARLSRPGCVVTTYTAAGAVRRGLEAQGFAMHKRPGFGTKREMLVGELGKTPRIRERAPWFRPPPPVDQDKRAIVIGAGIAGAQAAWHLAIRGWQATVVDRCPAPAREASGNPAAIISPRLTARPSIAEQFSVQAFLYQLAQFDMLGHSQCGWHPCGALQLAVSRDKLRQWHALNERGLPKSLLQCLDEVQSTQLAGIAIGTPSIHFDGAGYLLPAGMISTLLSHEGITSVMSCPIESLVFSNGQWQAKGKNNETVATAPVAVVASGSYLDFDQTRHLPHTPVQGQTSHAATSADSAQLAKVIQHEAYITPAIDGQHLLGASYIRNKCDNTTDPKVDLQTLSILQRHTPEIATALGAVSSGHSAIRMTSDNRMPYVGPVVNSELLPEQFPWLLKNQYGDQQQVSTAYPGLFISGAHGSRGFTNAALGGEIIAALVTGETPPVQQRLLHALHPARQLVKSLLRGVNAK